jgi:hypothetical protein
VIGDLEDGAVALAGHAHIIEDGPIREVAGKSAIA